MGGYGALKWALRQPERFAAAARLSGAVDMDRRCSRRLTGAEIFERVFHGRLAPEDDLFHLLEQADRRDPARALRRLRHGGPTGRRKRSVHRRRPGQGDRRPAPTSGRASHEWALWDAVIRDVLAWLP